MRSSGRKVGVQDTTKQYHISNSYVKLLSSITGKEKDIEALCSRLIAEARDINHKNYSTLKKTETPADLFNPEVIAEDKRKLVEDAKEASQEIDIERIRYEIRQEVLKEFADREEVHKKIRFEAVSKECLYRLVSACPKWNAEALASKAVEIATKFTNLF